MGQIDRLDIELKLPGFDLQAILASAVKETVTGAGTVVIADDLAHFVHPLCNGAQRAQGIVKGSVTAAAQEEAVEQMIEAAAYGCVRQRRVLLVCRVAGARDEHRRRYPGQSEPDARQVSSAPTPSSQLTDRSPPGPMRGITRTPTNMKVRL